MTISGFFSRRIADFKTWWHAPPTRKDRIFGAVVGVIGGFWVGLFAGMTFLVPPVPLMTLLWWAIAGIVAGLLGGIYFPKATTCICFPFSTIGGGGN